MKNQKNRSPKLKTTIVVLSMACALLYSCSEDQNIDPPIDFDDLIGTTWYGLGSCSDNSGTFDDEVSLTFMEGDNSDEILLFFDDDLSLVSNRAINSQDRNSTLTIPDQRPNQGASSDDYTYGGNLTISDFESIEINLEWVDNIEDNGRGGCTASLSKIG